MNKPTLVRLPSSRRGGDKAASTLGYRPHMWRSMRFEGYFAFVPEEDALKLFAAKRSTNPRVNVEHLNSCWNQPDPYRGTPPKDETCPHPDSRRTLMPDGGDGTYCCECGKRFIPKACEVVV